MIKFMKININLMISSLIVFLCIQKLCIEKKKKIKRRKEKGNAMQYQQFEK